MSVFKAAVVFTLYGLKAKWVLAFRFIIVKASLYQNYTNLRFP